MQAMMIVDSAVVRFMWSLAFDGEESGRGFVLAMSNVGFASSGRIFN
jgi:hypothetical protein